MAQCRVLIVEDEWLIARDYVAILKSAGHVIVGPVATAKAALALLSTEQVDIALVDFRLGGETSESIIQRLNQTDTASILVTGHSKADLPLEFASANVIAKPVNPQQLLVLIERLAG